MYGRLFSLLIYLNQPSALNSALV